jgi:hypothetical protein
MGLHGLLQGQLYFLLLHLESSVKKSLVMVLEGLDAKMSGLAVNRQW